MDSLPVHIAVLTIANDAASAERATAQAIVERARAAGHEVVDEETVKDSEGAIRDQLVRWIAQPDVDVVIVAASIDSNAASSALAPLIMQTLPGFTDLFRWLTFQEIGASAMLSAAEAAQCESTFVFVLPAHEAAVRAAMDKLILPQLDSNTKPKNLVSQMPRLKDAAKRAQTEPSAPMTTPAAAHHAVPVPIVAEKTSGGSGLPPKLPARTRQPTANIIARKPADPPTKQIDLAKLEKQIELSNVNEAQTKQIQVSAHDAKTKVVDMSAHQAKTRVVDGGRVLPRIPPGADDSAFDEDESLTFAEPPATMAKRISSPSGKGSPAATPPFATPIARSGGDRHTAPTPPAATPQLRQPPADRAGRHTAPTPPAATPQLRPPVAERADRHTAPTPPAATPQLRAPGGRPPATPPATHPSAPTSSAATPPATHLSAATSSAATPSATHPSASTSSAATSPATHPPATTSSVAAPPSAATAPGPTPPAGASHGATSSVATPPAGTSVTPAARTRQPTPPPPPVVKRPPTQPPPPPAARRSPTEPPPVSDDKKRPAPNAAELWSRAIESSDASTPEAATSARADDAAIRELEPSPDVDETSEATDDRPSPVAAALAESPARVRKPTPPPLPQVDPLAAITSRPIGGGDLPQGDFAYPIKRSGGGLLLKLLAGAAVAGLGFFAFIKLYPDTDRPAQTAAVAAPPSAPEVAAPVESAPPQPPAEEPAAGSAAAPEIEPEIEMGAPEPDEPRAPASTSRSRPSQRSGGSHAASPTRPAQPKPHDDATASTRSAPPPPANDGPDEAPAADPGCDEVSCVLSKYDRPCCERFKPTETFTPKNVVPDALDRTMVKAGIEKIKPRIVACGEKHHGKGTVKVSVTVDGSGKVKSASVTETPDPALGDCVQAALKDASFGKSVSGGDFVYPFVF